MTAAIVRAALAVASACAASLAATHATAADFANLPAAIDRIRAAADEQRIAA